MAKWCEPLIRLCWDSSACLYLHLIPCASISGIYCGSRQKVFCAAMSSLVSQNHTSIPFLIFKHLPESLPCWYFLNWSVVLVGWGLFNFFIALWWGLGHLRGCASHNLIILHLKSLSDSCIKSKFLLSLKLALWPWGRDSDSLGFSFSYKRQNLENCKVRTGLADLMFLCDWKEIGYVRMLQIKQKWNGNIKFHEWN